MSARNWSDASPQVAARWETLQGDLTLRLHFANRDTPVVHSIPKGAEYTTGAGAKSVYQWQGDGAWHQVVINSEDVVSSYAIQEADASRDD